MTIAWLNLPIVIELTWPIMGVSDDFFKIKLSWGDRVRMCYNNHSWSINEGSGMKLSLWKQGLWWVLEQIHEEWLQNGIKKFTSPYLTLKDIDSNITHHIVKFLLHSLFLLCMSFFQIFFSSVKSLVSQIIILSWINWADAKVVVV